MVDIRAGVCIVKNDKLLLLQARDGKEDGKSGDWGPPGGHGEANETFEQTAIREAKEEAGLDVRLTGLVQAALIKRDGKDIMMVLYRADIVGKQKIQLQEEEVVSFHWATRKEIEKDVFSLRNKLLKPVFLRALNNISAPVDTLIQLDL